MELDGKMKLAENPRQITLVLKYQVEMVARDTRYFF